MYMQITGFYEVANLLVISKILDLCPAGEPPKGF
jgi:hypothetical protein